MAIHRSMAALASVASTLAFSAILISACTPGAKGLAFRIPGVQLAGDFTDPDYPPTLEAAVRSGLRAARAVHGKG